MGAATVGTAGTLLPGTDARGELFLTAAGTTVAQRGHDEVQGGDKGDDGHERDYDTEHIAHLQHPFRCNPYCLPRIADSPT